MAKKKNAVLDFSPPIDLPAKFNPTSDKLLDFIDRVPIEAGFETSGTQVLPFDLETAWGIFFDEKAPLPWDSVKAGLEYQVKKYDDWTAPTLKKFKGKPVLAESKVIYESQFHGFMVQKMAANIFFEIQTTYLTEKAENAIVMHKVALASGFVAAKHYKVLNTVEIYQPDMDVEKCVVRLTYKNDWNPEPAIWEIFL